MSDCNAKFLAKPIECLGDGGHAGDHYGEDDAGFTVRWAPQSSAGPVDAARVAALEAKLAAAVARGCCDACAGAGGDPDCMCGGSGSAADAVVHLRNEYFAARAELQAAVARAEAAEEACREADPGLACASCGARSATGTTFTSVAQEMGDEDIECGACGSVDTGEVGPVLSRLSSDVDTLRSERDALRADLARVTASEASARQERDRIEEAALHNVREAFAQTTTARQEAEGLRAQVRAFLKADNEFAPPSTMDAHRRNLRAALSAPAPVLPGERRTPPAWWNDAYRDDVLLYACATAGMDAVDVIREQHRQRAQWEKIAHDAVATQRPPVYIVRDAPAPVPAPVPATPVSAIHNVGKPCPVCSGCDVCLGTGRAPHYVPAPVPATPAPDEGSTR